MKVADQRLLVPGRNCWRIDRAQRLAFLVDGDAYFRAVRAAIARAKRSVFILGWDIDSRMRLVMGERTTNDRGARSVLTPSSTRAPLACAASWIAWGFRWIREWMPLYKPMAHTSALSFRLDEKHPMGAQSPESVVTDAVACVGGWIARLPIDTPEHPVTRRTLRPTATLSPI